MHILTKAFLIFGIGALPALGASSAASAADLSLQRPHRAVVHHRHVRHHSRLVRDLDGTAILLRRVGVAQPDAYGRLDVTAQYEAVPVRGATPSRYLNGQRVLPHCPRNWPRAFCSRG